MSDQIPPEIVTNILCRLPVKHLLRFRCVSKPWCSQIDGPNFIKLHLKHSIETKSNLSVILSDYKKLYYVDLDSLDKIVEINHAYSVYTKVLGSCNGLLCICDHMAGVTLLNPSTRQHQTVPFMLIYKLGFGNGGYVHRVYGFGYYPIDDDYKVVKIAQFISSDFSSKESHVLVYSLKTNEWRRMLHDMPYFCRNFGNPGVFISGALHWIMDKIENEEITQIIIAFDLGAEDFREVPPPPEFVHSQVLSDVGVLGGCLTVLATYANVCADLWVMKKYGVKESWTKLLSVASPGLPVEVLSPLAYSKNGSQVLLQSETGNLLWYDLEKKSTNGVHIHGMRPNTFDSFTCVGSLVPLSVPKGTHGTKQQAQEQKKNIRKKRAN